jgi:ABC-type phosphate transport system substrate-binding protein
MKTTIMCLVLLLLPMLSWADLVVVVSRDNPQQLTLADIRKIYLGQSSTFADGAKALPVMYAEGTAERAAFVKHVLKISESQYIGIWAKLLFTGNGTPPVELPDNMGVETYILQHSQAIGYLPRELADQRFRIIAELPQTEKN